MSNKVEAFIGKHGYSFKSYLIALIVFPPACYLIAWKIPNIGTDIRILLSVMAFVVPTAMVMLGGAIVIDVFN